MFGRPANPYDEVVSKATDEKQTEINWEIALTVWDKVNEDGETGARNCVQALQKRLNHRSANVQLFSLTLAGALVNNCGPALHREISGKTFTQTLVRLINDRTTHETVRRSALSTLETIIREHPNDPNFDLLLETYESLKRQGVVFPSSQPAPSSSGAGRGGRNGARGGDEDEVLRREEEELQRALAESAALADPMRGYQKRGASPGRSTSSSRPSQSEGGFAPPPESAPKKTPTRVRALFDFQGQTAEELQLRRGEEVRVLEAVSDEWWRGESTDGRGRVGIFPVNYVEPLPDLPPAPSYQPSLSSYSQPSHSQQQQPQQETEEDLEASIFAQAASIDRLLGLMQTLRARGEDFAESEELTDLYNSSMRLRPKVVQLLRKYEQKQADLHSLSDKVQHAKTTYEQYVGIAPPPQQQQQQQQPYAQAQQNGFDPHAAQQHPLPIHQQQQQQQPPPLTAASPAPQAHPPHADPAQTEEQREYERKYAEYLRQLEEYNRQMAQIAQQQGHPPPPSSSTSAGGGPPTSQDPQAQQAYYAQHQQQQPSQAAPGSDPYAHQQQQQQQAPPPSVGSPAPQHLAQSSTSLGSPTPSAAQPPAQAQPQPVWDPSAGQWVWPAQHAHAAPPTDAAVEGGYAAHSAPAPALSPVNVPAQGQGYPAQTVPYPISTTSSTGGLEGGMAALSVSGTASPPPQGQAQGQAAYYPQQGQQQHQQDEHAAAWAAWHAAQAQQQQGLGQQPA